MRSPATGSTAKEAAAHSAHTDSRDTMARPTPSATTPLMASVLPSAMTTRAGNFRRATPVLAPPASLNPARDERLLPHRAQGHPGLAGEPVARRGDHHQLVLVEDLGIQLFFLDEALGQPEVQLVPGQPAVDLLGVLDQDEQFDPGVPVPELGHHAGQQVGADRRARPDRQPSPPGGAHGPPSLSPPRDARANSRRA